MDFGEKMGRGQYVVARGSKQRMAGMRIRQPGDKIFPISIPYFEPVF